MPPPANTLLPKFANSSCYFSSSFEYRGLVFVASKQPVHRLPGCQLQPPPPCLSVSLSVPSCIREHLHACRVSPGTIHDYSSRKGEKERACIHACIVLVRRRRRTAGILWENFLLSTIVVVWAFDETRTSSAATCTIRPGKCTPPAPRLSVD